MNAKEPRAPREERQGSSGFAGACWASYRSGGGARLGPFLRIKNWGRGVLLGKSGVRFFYFCGEGGCAKVVLDVRAGDLGSGAWIEGWRVGVCRIESWSLKPSLRRKPFREMLRVRGSWVVASFDLSQRNKRFKEAKGAGWMMKAPVAFCFSAGA